MNTPFTIDTSLEFLSSDYVKEAAVALAIGTALSLLLGALLLIRRSRMRVYSLT